MYSKASEENINLHVQYKYIRHFFPLEMEALLDVMCRLSSSFSTLDQIQFLTGKQRTAKCRKYMCGNNK